MIPLKDWLLIMPIVIFVSGMSIGIVLDSKKTFFISFILLIIYCIILIGKCCVF